MIKLEDILWHRFGSEEDYRRKIGEQSLAAFVRSIVGIEQSAVNEKYGARPPRRGPPSPLRCVVGLPA